MPHDPRPLVLGSHVGVDGADTGFLALAALHAFIPVDLCDSLVPEEAWTDVDRTDRAVW